MGSHFKIDSFQYKRTRREFGITRLKAVTTKTAKGYSNHVRNFFKFVHRIRYDQVEIPEDDENSDGLLVERDIWFDTHFVFEQRVLRMPCSENILTTFMLLRIHPL